MLKQLHRLLLYPEVAQPVVRRGSEAGRAQVADTGDIDEKRRELVGSSGYPHRGGMRLCVALQQGRGVLDEHRST